MADELKSMFRSTGNEMSLEELEEKQKYDLEMQRRREMNKKQSNLLKYCHKKYSQKIFLKKLKI